jgi:hypothetical protein
LTDPTTSSDRYLWGGGPPRCIPARGTTLTLEGDDWWLSGGRSLVIRIAGVRVDISRWYDRQWVWVEGHEVEHPDQEPPGHRMQIRLRVAAIPPAARDPEYQPDEVLPR